MTSGRTEPAKARKAPAVALDGVPQELQEQIRLRAYQLFEERGAEHGHELEDWLQAEAEILGNRKRPAA
jgi:Protein of unknown function (DUF2934)